MTYKIKNNPKKITPKKLAFLIKDERKASKEYHKLGLHSLARDEEKHYKYLKKLKTKKKLKN